MRVLSKHLAKETQPRMRARAGVVVLLLGLGMAGFWFARSPPRAPANRGPTARTVTQMPTARSSEKQSEAPQSLALRDSAVEGAVQRPELRTATLEALRLRQRVLDALQATEPAAPRSPKSTAVVGATPGTMRDRTGEIGAEVMHVLNDEFMPLLDECFDQARTRDPGLRGMLALNVAIAGVDDVGSIIEGVEAAQSSQLADAELMECVRQSAFSLQLPAPSKGGRGNLYLTVPLGE